MFNLSPIANKVSWFYSISGHFCVVSTFSLCLCVISWYSGLHPLSKIIFIQLFLWPVFLLTEQESIPKYWCAVITQTNWCVVKRVWLLHLQVSGRLCLSANDLNHLAYSFNYAVILETSAYRPKGWGVVATMMVCLISYKVINIILLYENTILMVF